MTASVPPRLLRQAVSELIAECRQHLREGEADVSQVYRGVQAYCQALTNLPLDEGRLHKPDLEALMQEVNVLGDELVAARDIIRERLNALETMKKAHVAYQKSDAIKGKKLPQDPDA